MLTGLGDDEVGAFISAAAGVSGLRGTPLESVVVEQQNLLRALLGQMTAEEVTRLHRTTRMSADLVSTPGVVKRAHTAGMNFDGDGSDPAAMTILREQQKILAGYAKDRGDNMRALKEARAEAWEAKAALRLVEEENTGTSVALRAAEERCEAMRAEIESLKIATTTTTTTSPLHANSTSTAVALYDAAMASGELSTRSRDDNNDDVDDKETLLRPPGGGGRGGSESSALLARPP